MSPLLKILSVLALLGGLIFVHELGHFLVAKLFRVKVLRFSLGFGPRIFGVTRGETEYRVSWLPLGGYVKMAGDEPGAEVEPGDEGRTFLGQPPWKRFLIALAGPAMNLVFPVALYFVAFAGTHQEAAAVVGFTDPERAAARQGLLAGDRIRAVDGKPMNHFRDLQEVVQASPGLPLRFELERAGQRIQLTVTPDADTEHNPIESRVVGRLGVTPSALAPVVAVTGEPASSAGLMTLDRIVKVGGQPIATYAELVEAVRAHGDAPLALTVVRDQELAAPGAALSLSSALTVTLTPAGGALGIEPAILYVWGVAPGTPAAEAGIRRGDKLLLVDGVPVRSMLTVLRAGAAAKDQRPLRITLARGGEAREVLVTQRAETVADEMRSKSTRYVLGLRLVGTPIDGAEASPAAIALPPMVDVTVGPMEAMGRAVAMLGGVIRVMTLGIAGLFRGAVPLDSVGGPLMLVDIAAKSAERGWMVFLHNMALISVNLGLLNLIPIPVLDGGHLLACVIESVRRRPLSLRAREVANMVGLFLLLTLMVFAFKNDIVRYFIP